MGRRVQAKDVPALLQDRAQVTSGSASYDVDVPGRAVKRGDRVWHVAPMEFMLLLILHANTGRVLHQVELQRVLYGDGSPKHDDNVRVMVQSLRRKIGPDVIDTLKGFGYGVGI